jgi:hypothetical protein
MLCTVKAIYVTMMQQSHLMEGGSAVFTTIVTVAAILHKGLETGMTSFAQRVRHLPVLGLGISTEYGAAKAPEALDICGRRILPSQGFSKSA